MKDYQKSMIKFKNNEIHRRARTLLYDYGNGYFKVVRGTFRESGWVECSPIAKKLNDLVPISTDAARSRAASRVREFALCNDWEYFYTQTFNINSIDRFSMEDITKKMQEMFKYYRKKKSMKFRYLVIAELHKNPKAEKEKELAKQGIYAIHLHGFVSGLQKGDLFVNDKGYTASHYFWKLGWNSMSPIKDKNRISSYILKYINKDTLQFSNRYYYLSSRGLQRAFVSEIDLEENEIDNWLNFEHCKIYNLDLNLLSNNDNMIIKERENLINIMNSNDVNSHDFNNILTCVKLWFPALYKKLGGA